MDSFVFPIILYKFQYSAVQQSSNNNMKITKHITLLIVLLPIVACFPADINVGQIDENVPTLLNLTKCCNEGEAFDINTRSCFQMESVVFFYVKDSFQVKESIGSGSYM